MAIRHDAGAPTAGQSYNITCTVILNGTTGSPTIEWLGPNNNPLLNSSSVTVENVVMVNDSAYDRTLVFSSLRTSHGGQYTCRAALGQVSAMASTGILVKSMCAVIVSYIILFKILMCDEFLLLFFLQFLLQQSPSHPITLVFSMLAFPSPSPAPFS